MRELSVRELEVVRLAVDLGASSCGGPLSAAEREVVGSAAASVPPAAAAADVAEARRLLAAGGDPLGERLCRARPARSRRALGAFYTPEGIVRPMVDWALACGPARLVDPGCGSGRFAAAAVRRRRGLHVVAIDVDPVATLLTRAALAVLGAERAVVRNQDFTAVGLPAVDGVTAWVGNPPYVRHHDLEPRLKAWAAAAGRELGQRVSGLASLHVLFFLAAARQGRPGDALCFVTSAEWLDVGYGDVVRRLYVDGLGGRGLALLDRASTAFDDAMTTALIACARIGEPVPTVRLRRVASTGDLGALESGRAVPRGELAAAERWSGLFEPAPAPAGGGVRLGSLVRVSRGVATGANGYFVLTRARAAELGLSEWCRPVIADAREILEADGVVRDGPERRVLLCLPRDLDPARHPAVEAYLRAGRLVSERYLCRHRRPWFALGDPRPAPILATYMARQPPRFARNPDGLLHVNVAHGLYPRQPMSGGEIDRLAAALNAARDGFVGQGRTYQGGLEKFEPREMEALVVPWV